MVIGLAGKSCAGKNAVGAALEAYGALHVDLDRLNHTILNQHCREIGELFSVNLCDDKGHMNRPALSELVFSDPEKLRRLEDYVYPRIEEEVEVIISQNSGDLILLNGAALHKSRLVHKMDRLVWVHSPYLLRIIRAMSRDKRSIPNIIKRFRNQREFSTQQFSSHVDIYKVYNGVFIEFLHRRVKKMYLSWIIKGETL
ncbi:MAG: dephospho-CoA kinase [Spirochaetales bacterium]|nr:dephospho-CoA kinase [Spirochaetales bacterium]